MTDGGDRPYEICCHRWHRELENCKWRFPTNNNHSVNWNCKTLVMHIIMLTWRQPIAAARKTKGFLQFSVYLHNALNIQHKVQQSLTQSQFCIVMVLCNDKTYALFLQVSPDNSTLISGLECLTESFEMFIIPSLKQIEHLLSLFLQCRLPLHQSHTLSITKLDIQQCRTVIRW